MKNESKFEIVGKYLQGIVNKSSGNQEAVDIDGGNTIAPEMLANILSPDFAEDSLYSRCQIFNTKRNGLKIPCADTSEIGFGTGIGGGVNAFWIDEGYPISVSKAGFSQLDLTLNKLVVTIPVTDELFEDSEAFGAYVSRVAEKAIIYKIDHAIIYGTTNQINGVKTSSATISVSAASPITIPNIKSMIDSYYGGSDGVFVMSKQAYNQVKDLYENTLALEYRDDGKCVLFGYPVIVHPVMANFDIVLGDFSQFAIAQKELRSNINLGVNFNNDEKVLRFVIRINGGNTWNSGLTLQTNVLSAGSYTVTEEFLNSISMTTPTTATSAWNAVGTLDYLGYSQLQFDKAITQGSLTLDVSGGTWTFADSLTAGILSPISQAISAGAMVGAINYNTGAFSLNFGASAITLNSAISATYSYTASSYEHDASNDITVYPFVIAQV